MQEISNVGIEVSIFISVIRALDAKKSESLSLRVGWWWLEGSSANMDGDELLLLSFDLRASQK